MTPDQALKTLISAAEIGQSKGAYTLKDSAIIFNAIAILSESNITSKSSEKPMDSNEEAKTEAAPAESTETATAQTEETTAADAGSTEEQAA